MNDNAPDGAPRNQTNTAGLVGFIISLVSLVGCGGLLSPISLIFSIVGMGKQPKGFAIAGLVLSLFGMSGCIIALIAVGLSLPLLLVGMLGAGVGIAVLVVLVAVFFAMGQNAVDIIQDIREYHDQNGVVPISLDELDLEPDRLLDHWKNEFVYVPSDDGDSFLLITTGRDGIVATRDDFVTEIRLDGEDFNVRVHSGYDDINRAEWSAFPQPGQTPTPEAPDPEVQPDTP